MRIHFNKIIFTLLFTATLYNCASYNNQLFTGEGDIEHARMNIIADFAKTYRTPHRYKKERGGKPFDVFWVFTKELRKNVFVFSVSPETDGEITLDIKDSLGKVPNSYFPNKFVVKEGKLFLWKDSITPLRKDIFDVIEKFSVLDSIDIKWELGLLPNDYEDTRTVTIDHKLKSAHYYVCKNNIVKHKKVVTNIAVGYYKPPKLKCGVQHPQ